jgi:hypothetical protein
VLEPPRLEVSPGPPGAFDEHGASMGSVVQFGGATLLFYTGWSLQSDVPWRNTIGLAVREDAAKEFRKVARPVLGIDETDRHSLSYPWVVVGADGRLVMWYGTNTAWGAKPADMEHVIRRAVSADGLSWVRDPQPCVPLAAAGEYALSRPSVWWDRERRRHAMLLSRRTHEHPDTYALALAFSDDGASWTRADDRLVVSRITGDWEREMTCYAATFEHDSQRMAVYCGNGFGRTGFGVATIEW